MIKQKTESFGDTLRRIRKSLNLTQKDVESQVSISAETLRRIENDINIPSISTIEELSEMYKIDVLNVYIKSKSNNILTNFYYDLDSLVINYSVDKLAQVTKKFSKIKKKASTHYRDCDLLQFEKLLIGLELAYSTDQGSRDAIDMYVEAIRVRNKEFALIDIKKYKYSYIELKCLYLIAIEYNVLKLYCESNALSLFLLDTDSCTFDLFDNMNLLTIKLLMNISYNYHGLNMDAEAFKYADMGVKLCLRLKTFYLLHGLYYRCGIALFILGKPYNEYMDYLNKSMSILDLTEMYNLKKQYIDVTKQNYSIDLTLHQSD